MKNPTGLLLLALSIVLAGCQEGDTITNVESPPPTIGQLSATFQGNFIPHAAADDTICRLTLVATVSGGSTPYTYRWSLLSLASSATSSQGYPNGATVQLTFDSSFGASGGDSHLMELLVTDAAGTQARPTAAEPLDCTAATSQAWTGI